jgi:hypothetical protein
MSSIVFLPFEDLFARQAFILLEIVKMHLPLVSIVLASIPESHITELASKFAFF